MATSRPSSKFYIKIAIQNLHFLSAVKKCCTEKSVVLVSTSREDLAPVVQTLDSAIHRIKMYPVDNAIGFPNTYPVDSDLSGG